MILNNAIFIDFSLLIKYSYFVVFYFTDKKPKPESIEIFTIKITERRMKILKMTLPDIWRQGAKLRINNFGDKDKPAHSDKDIRNQVIFAQKAKQMLWHNSKHFAYWCRYGDRQQDVRRRQVRIFLLTHILKSPN